MKQILSKKQKEAEKVLEQSGFVNITGNLWSSPMMGMIHLEDIDSVKALLLKIFDNGKSAKATEIKKALYINNQ